MGDMPLCMADIAMQMQGSVEGVRARHKAARPNPIENPAFANAEVDISFLLTAYDSRWTEMLRYKRALERIEQMPEKDADPNDLWEIAHAALNPGPTGSKPEQVP